VELKSINLITAAIFSAAVLILQNFLPGYENLLLKIFGLGCFFLALPLIVLPFYHLPKYGFIQEQSYMVTQTLVRQGIYSVVRHPQYLGYNLVTIGFSLLTVHWMILLCCAAALFFYHNQIKIEEKFLIKKFGQAYLDYMEKTPKLNFVKGGMNFIKNKGTSR